MKHHGSRRSLILVATLVLTLIAVTTAAAFNPDTRVNLGSPPAPFSQNKQTEPALAVDASHPSILVAGANDNIDMEACNAAGDTACPFTPGVGVSGVYLSFGSGTTWRQPAYTGWTARSCLGVKGNSAPACQPKVGPIGTLPKYFENGLVSDGDPALAFGPRPDAKGHFSWANGSRLYYGNLASNFAKTKRNETSKGPEAIAISRTDDVAGAAAGNANAWMAPVLVSSKSSTAFNDKDQLWADNAASSPFFGNVYLCWASFRSDGQDNASPPVLTVAISSDGGTTWAEKQLTSASTNPSNPQAGGERSGCTIRTDSHGVVYVFVDQSGVGTPGLGAHLMIKSIDGGKTWARPVNIGPVVNTCFLLQFDGKVGRCVMDGLAGARDDLSSAPSVDIANGAPTGVGATNEILRTWVDGRDGVNHEHVFVSHSTDGGATWSGPAATESAGDRGYYSAIAISPKGTDAYLVYNAFTTPLRLDTSSPRSLVGVVKHADIGANGVPGAWSELHRSAPSDPRGATQNNLWLEFLGDYVYAVATNTYGAAVWNDIRNAADCPAIDLWRLAAQLAVLNDIAVPPNPAPQQACPATFGNPDIFGGSFPDPTP